MMKPSGLLYPVENPDKPFQHIMMDFIMHIPTSTCCHNAIFSILDRYSRLYQFIPYRSLPTVVDCANLFFEHLVCRFGVLQKIISYWDVKFTR